MSYRTFKRVLGETSLERKCRFLFGACLLVLITGSFWYYGQKTEELVSKQNPIRGRLLVDTILVVHHWTKFPNSMPAEPPVHKEQQPVQGPEASGTLKPFAQDLADSLIDQSYSWRFVVPYSKPDGSGQPEDAFEEHALRYFKANRPQAVGEEPPEGQPAAPLLEFLDRTLASGEYQYYQPIYAKQSCVDCHNLYGAGLVQQLAAVGLPNQASGGEGVRLREGDLMALAEVRIPTRSTMQDLAWNRAILLATAIITVFLAMLASYVIVRYVIVKPLKHLRDVSDAISRGNINQRAEIHTADEFEALALAFNRMLRHLVEAHEELRHVNADLDAKVDELAQMNMRLYEMNRLKGDFLATMSHELRTPLNSIIGFSDVLGSISSLDDKQKRYVQNIQKSGKMLLDMINDILDLAKIESGKMEVRISRFRIAHVIGALCDMCRPLAEKKNIDLETDIQPALPELEQDQGKVQQVLNNLLSNAIKFTPEGGRIVIGARRDASGQLVLSVEDTGVGIAEEDQATIFEKFRQGKVVLAGGDAMTREYSGTGLGLSIVKELCRLLGGQVSVESELGKGSRFTVRLPWSVPERAAFESTLAESLAELTRARRADFESLPAAQVAE